MVDLVRPRFRLGQTVATPAALEAIQQAGQSPAEFLDRHVRGDWGDVCPEDAHTNEEALGIGARIFSAYLLQPPTGEGGTLAPAKVWLITEADRSVTTLLLPEEY